MKIALLAPKITKYREPFYLGLAKTFSIDFFAYQKIEEIKKQNMQESVIIPNILRSFSILSILRIYSFFPLLRKEYNVIILPAEVRSVSTWILLIIKNIINKKIILWGHGISIKNYLKEESHYPVIKRIFHNLADHIWLYTEKEKELLQNYIDKKKISALKNTIDITDILKTKNLDNKSELKKSHKINSDITFIFSARFTTPYRRTDVLLEIIENLDNNKYGFIIIGDGTYKPDFSKYNNVYDFGTVYEKKLKTELFSIADLYLQPGWIGLSAVEAMAYGKPILTLKRSKATKQCVEYNYIHTNINGFIANNTLELLGYITKLTPDRIKTLQNNARLYAAQNLSMNNMILTATNSINHLIK